VRFGELFSPQNSTTVTPASLATCARKDEPVLKADIDASGDVVVTVHVQPGARRTEVVGRHGDALKVRVTAPPVGGRANQAVIALLAAALAIPPSSVQVAAGTSSRRKRLRITAPTNPTALLARLHTLANDPTT
jgi:uncharacterized protein (TIGR00251 family)